MKFNHYFIDKFFLMKTFASQIIFAKTLKISGMNDL